jgi:hypothetical protein
MIDVEKCADLKSTFGKIFERVSLSRQQKTGKKYKGVLLVDQKSRISP